MSLLHEEPGSPLSMHAVEFDESRVRLPVRSRIIERLIEETGSRSGGRRLTLVKAPTGYGKTRTVLTWLGDGNNPADGVRWVQSAPSHAVSPPLFWRMVARALEFSNGPSLTVAEDPQEQAAELATQLNSPVTLIIDDYHHATSAENDLALSRLSALSPFLSLVVIARRVTLLDRTVITATTRVRLIGTDVLALTTAEAIDLASSLGVPASDELHDALQQTAGWPLAIRAALNLGSDELYLGASPGARRWNDAHEASTFFDPVVNLEAFALDSLQLLSDSARRIVLISSVLDALDMTLIEQTLGLTSEAATEALQQLLEFGLLVEESNPKQTEYRCHRSVRSSLRAYALRTLDHALLQSVYRSRAMNVSETAPFTAFRLFCASEEYEKAEILLARNFTAFTDEVEVCSQVLRAIPESVLQQYPTFAAAMLFLEIPRTEVAPATLSYLTSLWVQGLHQQLPNPFEPSNSPIHLALLAQAMIAARLTGQFDQAMMLMQHLEGRLTPASTDLSTASSPPTAGSLVGSLPSYYREAAATAIMAGDLAQTRRSLERLKRHSEYLIQRNSRALLSPSTRRVSDAESGKRWMLVALGELAFAEALDGNMHECARVLAEMDAWQATHQVSAPGIAWIGAEIARAHLSYELEDEFLLYHAVTKLTPVLDRIEAWPLLLVAEAASLRNTHGVEKALAHIDSSLLNLAAVLPANGAWSEYLFAYQAMLRTTSGDLAHAQQLLAKCDAESTQVRLERARLALYMGDDVESLLLAQQVGTAGATTRQRLTQAMIASVAAWNCKRTEEAFLAFDTVAELLERHGLRSVLRNVPHDTLRELAVAAQAAGIGNLVAAIDAIPEILRSRRYERLTEMELRTLTAIAEHRNASQAAAALFITPGTVKKHLASVYRKLRVNGRDEALLQANRMGLLQQGTA